MKVVKSLFVGLCLLLFCCNSSFATTEIYTEGPEVVYDGITNIPMSDGVNLDCMIIYPKFSSPHTLPVILFPNSWSIFKQEYITQALAFAKMGYLTVSFTMRGWYSSEGLIDVLGPTSVADFGDIYKYLETRQFTNVRADLSITGSIVWYLFVDSIYA